MNSTHKTNRPACKYAAARVVLALLVLVFTKDNQAAEPSAEAWSEIITPTAPPVRSIGSTGAGCIAGAVALSAEGLGYQVMRPSRRRSFGHPALIEMIQTLAKRVYQQMQGVLLIGDLSQARGGPMRYGHRSHQTGLDVDIWYWMPSLAQRRLLTHHEREHLAAPSLVPPAPNFPWKVLQIAAELDAVDRIFVHAAIKRYLCDLKPSHFNRPLWLRKIRPWWGHDDHFHVRLKCPAGSSTCGPQEPLPAGDGCDALEWWFTEEALHPKAPIQKIPKLPQACTEVFYMPPRVPLIAPALEGKSRRSVIMR